MTTMKTCKQLLYILKYYKNFLFYPARTRIRKNKHLEVKKIIILLTEGQKPVKIGKSCPKTIF